MTTYASFRAKWLPTAAFAISAALAVSLAGCNSNTAQPAPIVDGSAANGGDPAAANLAPVSGSQSTQVMGTSQSYAPQQQSQDYPQQPPAPIQQNYSQAPPPSGGDPDAAYDEGYNDGQAAVEVSQAPPPLPEYDQPEAPDPNDLWTPGYWYYGSDGYYWVPGAWVAAPYYGALWTPGYWGYYGGRYRWHGGYWGRHVGYYGGINYGFGYGGLGYEGGYWQGNSFYYNRSVNRVTNNIHNVYEHQVSNVRPGRVSYNGPGGAQARPQPAELAAAHEQRTRPMQTQMQLRTSAASDRNQSFNNNHGRPAQTVASRPVAATPGITAPPVREAPGARPGEFNNNRPGEMNRPGQPNNGIVQPSRPGEPARPGVMPNQPNRPAEQTRPGAPVQGQPNRGVVEPQGPGQVQNFPNRQPEMNRPQQPQPNHVTPEQIRPQQPARTPEVVRPQQPVQPNRVQPEQGRQPEVRQEPGRPQPQPMQRPVAPQPPHVEAPRPAPHVEAPRPAPAPHAEAPHPAPAPHPAQGGGGHEEHR